MTVLVEVQASHVGLGKSTFCERLARVTPDSAFVDDCVELVSGFGSDWYDKTFLSDCRHPYADSELKNFLTVENVACAIRRCVETHRPRFVFVARSPVVSAVQFTAPDHPHLSRVAKNLVEYYRTRLPESIDRVVVLDFGDAVVDCEIAYERMVWRNRKFELDKYDSLDAFARFFERCESVKTPAVRALREISLFDYVKVDGFNHFDERDAAKVWKILEKYKGPPVPEETRKDLRERVEEFRSLVHWVDRGDDATECCVCSDAEAGENDTIRVLPCGHTFHRSCRRGSRDENACAVCRETQPFFPCDESVLEDLIAIFSGRIQCLFCSVEVHRDYDVLARALGDACDRRFTYRWLSNLTYPHRECPHAKQLRREASEASRQPSGVPRRETDGEPVDDPKEENDE